MSRIPLAIGALSFLAIVVGSVAFALDTPTVAPDAAAMLLIGTIGIGLGGLTGLLLVRAPWSRWILAADILIVSILASVGGGLIFWFSLALGLAAIIGLAGPWLTLWVRRQPVADQLGRVPVLLISSGALAPVVVGLSSYQGIRTLHWIAVGVVMVSAWAYGRGLWFGIWGFRVVGPVVGFFAAAQSATPGSAVIAAGALALGAAAWMPQARQVTAVITPPLPAPAPRKEPGNANQ